MAVAEHPAMAPTAYPAGFAARLAAYVLDWLVTFILACVCTASAGLLLLLTSDMGRTDPPDRAIYAALIIATLVVPVWFVMTLAGWTWEGRSIGKLAMNLRILDRRGHPPGVWRAMLRLAVYIVENVPVAALAPTMAAALLLRSQPVLPVIGAAFSLSLLVPLVSTVLVLHDRRHRALHDFIAGTVVVSA